MNLRCDPRRSYEISKTAHGSLAELPFARLLQAHWEHERSHQIEVRHGQAVKTVSVRDGVPINCDSNLAHEWLGRMAVAQRWVPQKDILAALAEARGSGVPLGLVLVEWGLVDGGELNRLLQQGLAAKLLDLFSWQDGRFEIRFGPQKEVTEQKLHVPQLILTGVCRFMPGEAVTRQLEEVRRGRFRADSRPVEETLRLSLTEPQQRIVDCLREKPRSLAEVIRATRLPLGEVERTLYALGVVGVVGTEEDVFGDSFEQNNLTTQDLQVLDISGLRPGLAAGADDEEDRRAVGVQARSHSSGHLGLLESTPRRLVRPDSRR